MPWQSIRGDISSYSPQPERLCHWSHKEWAYCSGSGPWPGLVECVALLCDLRVHSHSSIPNQLADSRLYEIETGLSPFGLSLQVMSASSLEMGLFPLSYRFYPPLFFFLTTCLDRKSSKNLRLNRK